MKTKFLLIYGYLIPFLISALISLLPRTFWFISYEEIAGFLSENLEILLGFLTLMIAVTWPFQTKIINEDNPHVLAVLQETKVRIVFVRSSVFQAVLIVCLALLVLILSSRSNPSAFVGFIELFSLSLITFESVALISNGRSYGKIREQIIVETNKAKNKNEKANNP